MKKSMNLHRSYVIDWAAWEIARELVSNSIDACGDDYVLESRDGNNLVITTPTHPTLSQMLHVGSGTKTQDSCEIGIFGEGFKLALLVATRMGSIVCQSNEGLMTFSFEKEYGEEILHVDLDTSKKSEDFIVTVQVPGVGAELHTKILKNRKNICLPKFSNDMLRVFHKGIWVADLEGTHALWDWNLPKLTINRDRNLVQISQIAPAIRAYMFKDASQEQWDAIFTNLRDTTEPDRLRQKSYDITPTTREYCLEVDAVFSLSSNFGPENPQEAYDAFFNVFGKQAVVCSKYELKTAAAAVEAGYIPVFGPGSFETCAIVLGLPLASAVLENKNSYKSVDVSVDDDLMLKKIQKFLKRFNISIKLVPCILVNFNKELTYDEAEEEELEPDRICWINDKKVMIPYYDKRSTADILTMIFRAKQAKRQMFSSTDGDTASIAGHLAADALENEYDCGF